MTGIWLPSQKRDTLRSDHPFCLPIPKTTSNNRRAVMADLVSKYLEQIHQKTGGSQCVYRGQADARWLLQSSAERRIKRSFNDYIRGTRDEILRAYQTNLLSEARQKGFGHQEGRKLTDLQLLAQ